MSITAAALAGLVKELTSDLPFDAHAVEQRLGTELEREPSSNQYFTVLRGSGSSVEGLVGVEVREPTLQSIGGGKNGLVLLEFDEGPAEDDLTREFEELEHAPAPYPGAPQDRDSLEADYPWGRLTIAVDRASRRTRTVLLDTAP